MSDFYEHVLFGLLLASVTAYILDGYIEFTVLEASISVLLVFIGSVLPDIDNKNAYVHRAVRAFTSLTIGIITFILTPYSLSASFFLGITAFLAVFTLISSLKIKHRGITHTLSFCIILTSLCITTSIILINSSIPGIALGIGILSHLTLDKELKL